RPCSRGPPSRCTRSWCRAWGRRRCGFRSTRGSSPISPPRPRRSRPARRGWGGRWGRVRWAGGLLHDLPALARAVTSRTRVVFVCNPNNPTGTSVGAAAFDAFVAGLPQDLVLLVDEAYCEFAQRPDFPDALAWVARRPGTLIVRTFSKLYGLAGARVGYGIADRELARYLERARHPFNLNVLAEAAAVAALDDREHVERTLAAVHDGLGFLTPAPRAP